MENIKRLKDDLKMVIQGSLGHAHINKTWAFDLLNEIENLQTLVAYYEDKIRKVHDVVRIGSPIGERE